MGDNAKYIFGVAAAYVAAVAVGDQIFNAPARRRYRRRRKRKGRRRKSRR